MISREVIEAIRHSSVDDALSKAHDARNEHLVATQADVISDRKRIDAVDMRSLLLAGFAIVQGGLDIIFAARLHGQ